MLFSHHTGETPFCVAQVEAIIFRSYKLSGPARPKGNINLSLDHIQAVLLEKIPSKNARGWFTQVGPSFYLESSLHPGTVGYTYQCVSQRHLLHNFVSPSSRSSAASQISGDIACYSTFCSVPSFKSYLPAS